MSDNLLALLQFLRSRVESLSVRPEISPDGLGWEVVVRVGGPSMSEREAQREATLLREKLQRVLWIEGY